MWCGSVYTLNMRGQVLVLLTSGWIYFRCFLSDVKVSSFGGAMPDL